jgi:hypothetical protein
MPSGQDGKHYRTYGQAERFGKKQPSEDKTDNAEGGNEVGKGANVVMIKHAGTAESPEPPFHVKHADGSKHGPMHSKEELMAHMHEHMGGGELGEDDSHMDSDYGMEGSKEAIDSLLG